MIQVEHFVYALFNGIGYKLIKTPKVTMLLNFEQLMKLKEMLEKYAELPENEVPDKLQQWYPQEQLVVVSYLKQTKDEYNRKGIYSDTIIMPITDYLQWTQPSKCFETYFITGMEHPPETLEPIQVT